jgi:hypothetical protein
VSPKLAVLTTAVALAASATYAQDPRVEIGVVAGWTLSDGVTTDSPVQGGDGVFYNSIEPDDAFSYSLNVGFFVNPNFEIGGLFSQQKSKMLIGGVAVRELGDWSVNNYHGYFAYNTGDFDSKARFYILGGLGATQYGGLSFTAVNGSTREIGGETLFSTTWGAGVKLYPGKNVGLKLGMRWTPTYIKSDAEGWWCDPYWGCYVVGDAQYSNQWEFAGGLTFRF